MEAGERGGRQAVDSDLPDLGSRTPPGAGGSRAGAAPWHAPAARRPTGGGREDAGNGGRAHGMSAKYARAPTLIAPMTPWMMPGLWEEGPPLGSVQVSPGGQASISPGGQTGIGRGGQTGVGRDVPTWSMGGGVGYANTAANAANVPQLARHRTITRRGGDV